MTKKTKTHRELRTKQTPRTGRKPPDISRQHEKPVDAEIQRAAKRAGIEVPTTPGLTLKALTREQAVEQLCESVGTKLVQASDMVAERVAAERSKQRWDDDYLAELAALLDLMWEIRWELSILPEDVRVEPTVLRKLAVMYEAAANAQPDGGAS